MSLTVIQYYNELPSPLSLSLKSQIDIIFREVTPGNRLVSRRLLTKTNRAPRWMEKYLPVTMARHAYIIEDSIVDPQNRTMTTLTWNISHARMMVRVTDWENRTINREAWISSNLYGLSRAIQVCVCVLSRPVETMSTSPGGSGTGRVGSLS
uniref:PRELI domain containing 1a n=1 Tax=Hucho hucho TaxID=62062 RepID=A0A4W5KGF0_9TELE